MEDIIEKINNILRFQTSFYWKSYEYHEDSFKKHVRKHPIRERYKYRYGEKWNAIIDYFSYKTTADSYYKVSTDLAKKFCAIPTGKYDVQYIKDQDSVNIVDLNNGLIVCLKYNPYNNYFEIATCFFPSKLNELFSIKSKVFSEYNNIEEEKLTDKLHFIPYKDADTNKEININIFEEAMEDFFGSNSIEYQILFKKESNNIDNIIKSIINDVSDYLNLMDKLIKNEYDKAYYFVFNDGIEYIAKWSLLYKIKDNNYERLYQKFLNIDINNVYKDALDLCKKYIDEGERNNERRN